MIFVTFHFYCFSCLASWMMRSTAVFTNCESVARFTWNSFSTAGGHTSIAGSSANPAFFSGVSQFYSYLDSDTKWGLFNGFSSRPMMPIAIKMLLSKTRLKEDEELVRQLKVSKEDVRLLKLYNMLSVT